jgi:hypothetical protein
MAAEFPTLVQVVLDSTDTRGLAEFYRQLLGYAYRQGDEPPPPGQPDPNGQDWLVIQHPSGSPRVAFQQVAELPKSTWPAHDIPQQLHLDLSVPSLDQFHMQHQRALQLGATMIYDRSDDPQEPLHVYADPAGHPFCIFVAG